MFADKRKRTSLDSFVTVTKKTVVAPSSSEQTETDQSELNTFEVAEIIDDKLEKSNNINSSEVSQNLNAIDY